MKRKDETKATKMSQMSGKNRVYNYLPKHLLEITILIYRKDFFAESHANQLTL